MTDTATTDLTSSAGFDLTPPTEAERKRLEAGLTREEAEVLLHHGTEAPFCGGLLGNKEAGVYCCRLCGLPLFRFETKFESGTGWPSFYAPFSEDHVRRRSATPATAWSAARSSAPAATATRATSSPTARRRPACATASTRSRWSS